jgi:DNA-binding transcriptional ArsR family regulator
MAEMANGLKAQADLFRALSHPVRLRIMDILAHQEACVCHLTAVLDQRQPYVSQQLALLREAGLVTDRREGTLIYYRLASQHLARLVEAAKTLVEDMNGQELEFALAPAGALEGCPCPHCQA